jgi:hypothetical protein
VPSYFFMDNMLNSNRREYTRERLCDILILRPGHLVYIKSVYITHLLNVYFLLHVYDSISDVDDHCGSSLDEWTVYS